MRLFIKRDKSSNEQDFVIFSESGDERYRTQRKKSGSEKSMNIKICGTDGQIRAKIRKMPFPATNIFVLRADKSRITFVVVPTKNGLLSYFYGNNWHVSGSIETKNFSVIDVDKSVVFSHMRHSGYTELEINDEANELLCVAASVCVNMINTVEKHELMPA